MLNLTQFMSRLIALACWLLLLGCQSKEITKKKSSLTSAVLKDTPAEIQFITSDINLFWKMYDREAPLFTKLEVDEQYFDAGTHALQSFYNEKIKSSDAFANLLNNRFDRRYYESVRNKTLQIQEKTGEILAAFEAFEKRYPRAVFTNVVFVIGGLDTGGVLLPSGQIVITAEMFAKSPDTDTSYLSPWLQSVLHTPDYLPVIALHELIHLQQQQFGDNKENKTLLNRALLEGSADFITHLILDKFLNQELLVYGNPREEQLWNQFHKKMHQRNFSGWLYNGNAATDQPADLGYYIGFKIAEYYYNNTADKQQALRDIIEMKNGKAFLEKSGYADSFK